MLNSEEHALALADEFYSAALGTSTWYSALAGFATATGSGIGELIALGPNATVPIHLMTNCDPALHADFLALRGNEPEVNPRVDAGMRAPALTVLAENDFLTPEEHRKHPHYQEFARPWDIPYICLSTLDRRDGVLIGLAVCRSEREGHISTQQRHVFAALAPHVRAAVRMQMSLETEGAKLSAGLLEALSLPAFLCNRSGIVQAMTPAAEAIIARGHSLQVKARQLIAANDLDNNALVRAIEGAANTEELASRIPRTVIVRSIHRASLPLAVDVIRLPTSAREFSLNSCVLVVPQVGANSDSRRRALLQAVYRFTAAETDVAMQVSQGQTVERIASTRGVAVATVRAQIKSILSKLGLTRQIELVAQLGQL
jgi:DNA-binding CsgD family transcriptional regulator